MVRWRYCLVLAILLLLPVRTSSEEDEDEDPDDDGDDNDSDGDEDDDAAEKVDRAVGRRAPSVPLTVERTAATRTMLRRPLECYICAYKAEMPLRSCLDPTKNRVHTMTCHNLDDKCFTSVISKGNNFEAIMRGCRSGCVGTPEVTCCELNRCNNQQFAMPVVVPRAFTSTTTSKSTKPIPQTVLFFITVLLVLQTVVKVAVV